MAVLSILISAVGVVLSFAADNLAGPFVGLVMGIVGLVLSVKAEKDDPSGESKAGVAIAVITIAICIIRLIAVAACVSCAANTISNVT